MFDLIGDVDPTDEDEDIGMGDSTGVSASLDGEIFSGGKKCQELNIGDSDNTGDGVLGCHCWKIERNEDLIHGSYKDVYEELGRLGYKVEVLEGCEGQRLTLKDKGEFGGCTCFSKSGGNMFDLIGDVDPTDEDEDIGMGDSTGISASLDGELFSGGKKCQESNIGDSDNTGDGGKIVGRAIGACSG
uniref:Uncharacterized protein n=1 Tax=Tanacetum cinerariifolium TaxID=118510 RepID=A0A6L2KFG7_TANCI|nr:hypothetical protein [Tanacetum cinerariifolium]